MTSDQNCQQIVLALQAMAQGIVTSNRTGFSVSPLMLADLATQLQDCIDRGCCEKTTKSSRSTVDKPMI
jgi:hypothetical protein